MQLIQYVFYNTAITFRHLFPFHINEMDFTYTNRMEGLFFIGYIFANLTKFVFFQN